MNMITNIDAFCEMTGMTHVEIFSNPESMAALAYGIADSTEFPREFMLGFVMCTLVMRIKS